MLTSAGRISGIFAEMKRLKNLYHRLLTQESEVGDIQAVVDKCWQDIGNICGDETVKKSLSSPFDPRIRGWRVVRLFVSSTFADYHAEREVLVKKVSLVSFLTFAFCPLR